MVVLSLMLGQATTLDPTVQVALLETALDAAVLPRHKQELLGKLARMAAGHGSRDHAAPFLSAMATCGADLETESEFRVSAAAVATLDGDWSRVTELLLGPSQGVIPISQSLTTVAAVLRANALERSGDVEAAIQALREVQAPADVSWVLASFPALDLCAQSAKKFMAAATQEAAARAGRAAGQEWNGGGCVLLFIGTLLTTLGAFAWNGCEEDNAPCLPLGVVLLVFAAGLRVVGRCRAKRAAALWANGLSCMARIVSAEKTAWSQDDVPFHLFTVQVAGPQGPYTARFKKLTPEDVAAAMVGSEVRVRVNSQNYQEIMLEE